MAHLYRIETVPHTHRVNLFADVLSVCFAGFLDGNVPDCDRITVYFFTRLQLYSTARLCQL